MLYVHRSFCLNLYDFQNELSHYGGISFLKFSTYQQQHNAYFRKNSPTMSKITLDYSYDMPLSEYDNS